MSPSWLLCATDHRLKITGVETLSFPLSVLVYMVFLDLYHERKFKHFRKGRQVSQQTYNSWYSVSADKLTFRGQPRVYF